MTSQAYKSSWLSENGTAQLKFETSDLTSDLIIESQQRSDIRRTSDLISDWHQIGFQKWSQIMEKKFTKNFKKYFSFNILTFFAYFLLISKTSFLGFLRDSCIWRALNKNGKSEKGEKIIHFIELPKVLKNLIHIICTTLSAA